MGRWEMFRRGFRSGWRGASPQERAKTASAGIWIGGAIAVVALVFISSQ
ncbi:hypothetical protein BMF35_a1484 [Aurantiacibacter gangjinensis]|nr:hypothetical protein BMF35_a1484 [Aurantiacibacter gangjinensis]